MWSGWCELATFFTEMIVRLIIIGMSLSRSNSVSRTSVIVRAETVSHRVTPADGKQRRLISESRFNPTIRTRATYSAGMDRIPSYESGSNGQRVSNSGTSANKPTLAATCIITINRWDVVITAKYISVSLPTVSRIFGTSNPWRIDLKNCIWMVTSAKTMMSEGTGRWVNSGEWEEV